MEEFLHKKIQVWIVSLVAIFLIIGTILFSNRYEARISLVVDNINKIIFNYYNSEIIDPSVGLRAQEQRFKGEKGFTFNYMLGARPDLGYLLLNRYDRDLARGVTELTDLNTQEQIHLWNFDVDPLWE